MEGCVAHGVAQLNCRAADRSACEIENNNTARDIASKRDLVATTAMAAIMDLLIDDSEDEAKAASPPIWPKAPGLQEWADLLLAEESPPSPRPAPRGQVRQITRELHQDLADDSFFRVDGKDKSWFLQKGGVTFNRPDAERFRLDVTLHGSCFGEDYAELSRLEQAQTTNWLIAIGVAHGEKELSGYQDSKTSGFYFIFHINYRRTRWRIIASPHDAVIEDLGGEHFQCDPQVDGHFEIDAFEGQTLSVEFINRELWIAEGAERKALGVWACSDASKKLPEGDYFPAVLTSNCPTLFSAKVGFQNSQPLQPPMHPPDRGPQHLPRRPSRSKLSEAEPATRRF
eukprot:symbB.v1.2.030898.t1/scaffold3528.1/size54678/4